MKTKAVIFLFLSTVIILGGMTSCDLAVQVADGKENQDVNQQYSTVSALLTKTAIVMVSQEQIEKDPVSTPVVGAGEQDAVVNITPTPEVSVLAQQATIAPVNQLTPVKCNIAKPGHPFDITIPDDARFFPGQYFSKTWRIINAGDCVWTSNYAVAWFSGDILALNQVQPLLSSVEPGSSIEVTVEMVAPQLPGVYQSNWKLQDEKGHLFGIGPNGDAPFWVRIVVLPVDTPTATLPPTPPTPVATPTPLVYASGRLTMDIGQGIDLDSGQQDGTEENDLIFEHPEDLGFFIAPENNARLITFGGTAPGLQDCSLAEVSEDPIDLQQVTSGSYLCYWTNQGLPGRIYLSNVDLEQSTLEIEFVTWVVP